MKCVVQVALVCAMVMMARAADPVNVGVYYESLCPDSKGFISTQLWPAWQKVSEIFTVHFVPFGNANFSADGASWDFTCQHGPEECVGNKIHACALKFYPDNAVNVPFISCSMSAEDPVTASEGCAKDNNLDWDEINACYTADEGSELLYDNGLETQALNPTLTWVPWVIINDVWTEVNEVEATYAFLKLVCDTYEAQGGVRPDACPAA